MDTIKLVIFDMAGTTVRDEGNVEEAFMQACKEHGIDMPQDEIYSVMGFRKKDAIRILLDKVPVAVGSDTEELIEQVHDTFNRKMIAFYEQDETLQPLPYAEKTFGWLKNRGVKVALNTGFTRAITDTILKRLHWDKNSSIDYVIASDEVPEGRPHPYMVQAIMQELKISDAGNVVKIGDTEVDIKEGRNAGCGLVIGITTGAYTNDQLQQFNPDKIIDSLADLPSLIQ